MSVLSRLTSWWSPPPKHPKHGSDVAPELTLHTFDGGVHPPEHKHESTQQPIQPLPMPTELWLPVSQHIGQAAVPCVSEGDYVLKGQCIANADGFLSVPIHAPTSATVGKIEAHPLPHSSGLDGLCIQLLPDGKDHWGERTSALVKHGVDDAFTIAPSDLVEHIRHSGIAGMGGAGFPSAVKLATDANTIDTLIINAAECEPYITADDMLMRTHSEHIILGIRLLQHIVSAPRVLIGIEDNKPDAIEALKRAKQDLPEAIANTIHVVVIPTKYPSGGEKQLIQILTGREVPSQGLPSDIGVVCQNIATAYSVARAVYHGEPLISRITTVTGGRIQQPRNWEVLMGTQAHHLLNASGYEPAANDRVILGGPMMGFAINPQAPMVKTSNCLLVPNEHELAGKQSLDCIRCGLCTQACPAGLLPQQLYWFAKHDEFDKTEQHNLFDCIECGACAYVCPSQIPLVQHYRYAKGAIKEERAAQKKAEHARVRYEQRLERLEREQAEKEAKRQARIDAAAKMQAEKAKAAPVAANTASSNTTSPNTAASHTAHTEQSAHESKQADIAKAEKTLSLAENRLLKIEQQLSDAKSQGLGDKVAALQATEQKQRDKIDSARAALRALQDAASSAASATEPLASNEVAHGASPEPSPAPVNDEQDQAKAISKAEKTLSLAENRLVKIEQQLSDAISQGLDEKAAALVATKQKQCEKIELARAALAELASTNRNNEPPSKRIEQASQTAADANSTTSNAANTQKDDSGALDALIKKLRAQQDRCEKTHARLSQAQHDNVSDAAIEALKKAAAKQDDKYAALARDWAELTNDPLPC